MILRGPLSPNMSQRGEGVTDTHIVSKGLMRSNNSALQVRWPIIRNVACHFNSQDIFMCLDKRKILSIITLSVSYKYMYRTYSNYDTCFNYGTLHFGLRMRKYFVIHTCSQNTNSLKITLKYFLTNETLNMIFF